MEELGLLLGIDALIDPIRTSDNVLGHCTAPAVIARWESVVFPSDLRFVVSAETKTKSVYPIATEPRFFTRLKSQPAAVLASVARSYAPASGHPRWFFR